MKFKKKYLYLAIVLAVITVNLISTMRLVFSVAYPDRMLKEVVTEYFKNNLDKAVKFEDLYIDFTGDIVILDFDMSITSDFNDNISLIKSSKAVIDLGLLQLVSGTIAVRGVDFYRSDMTLLKKYGKTHLECFEQMFGPGRFLRQIRKSGPDFYVRLHRATVMYRETLRDRQLTMELNKVNASMELDRATVSYSIEGTIKPYRTETIRKGSFSMSGTIDIGKGDTFSHRVQVDNMDLTYLNEHIAEYKLAEVALLGGASVDLEIGRKKGLVSVKGSCETNNLSIASLPEKRNLVSNENLNADIDLVARSDRTSYAARVLNLRDDTFSIEASGSYVNDGKSDAVTIRFKTNSIDLGDLSQNFTPYRDVEYDGKLKADGAISIDFRNNKAEGTAINASLEEFTVKRTEKNNEVVLLDESSMAMKLTDRALSVDIAARPLGSDLALKSRTAITNWVPFRSATTVGVTSKKMNLENIRNLVAYLIEKTFVAAYEDKRGGAEKVPFLQKPLGKFLNNNSIALNASASTVFYGRKARWKDLALDAKLERGAVTLGDFSVDGYGAKYRLGVQAYCNSDQPYIKMDAKIEDFDFGAFYADSGMKGSASGTARGEFSFEVSVARLGDMLDNAKGSLSLYLGKGTMSDTKLQLAIQRFLRKNGYDADAIATINYEDISFSASQQGENFWFSNFAVRGDTLLFGTVGDYMFESGMSSMFSATVRKEGGLSVIPLKLYGPILAPCIDLYDRKDSRKACF
jgi:hypothetical protein